ncbi:FAD-dependent oxidoreductase [Arenibacter aquaticus]|uniref:FAD-dependent oxidoreductase n=1 Tax=Arenibacter aquaticus TaxID=2489054 RepID=A0A3S0AGI7_9FLAO|nr:FAD-dependent oxidoreductase [Arenibacter aquaticus]RTE55244.1 FAD-dependent oxidoreductase [Arenibacter aquaticus]
MGKVERRSVLKAIGLASVGAMTPAVLNAEVLKEPYKVIGKSLKTDVLIVGGGTAGTIAAIQAGRAGARTILIESGSQLGGTMTTGGVTFPGIFHAWGKQIIGGIGWELVTDCVKLNGDKLPDFSIPPDRHWKHQVSINGFLYTLLAEEKCIEAGVGIRYYEAPTSVKFVNGEWVVHTMGKGIITQITCNQIIDCTGNASITSMAGFDVLRETETQPGSLIFQIGGYDYKALDLTKIPKQYHHVLRQNMVKNQLRTSAENTFVPYGYVYVPEADSSSSESHTMANRDGRSTLLNLIRKLRTFPGCENLRILDLKTETAVRETYRIDGEYKISHEDYLKGKVFEDAISNSFYPIDLHREGKTIYQEFLEPDVVASIPLRALIPKKSKNFLVAGRCVSSDRMANSALRVQASSMGMGQAAAAAAVLANKQGVSPLQVPVEDVKKLIREHGGILPITT